ncbi:HDOD domain-containing protein [Pseudodesulfovibrio sp.]|uniref:EAL and HDOD domain-containing protein n=1 Tax=Pseudodesulfovibrio sp. TaxID=2035812 RepID=UPI002609ECEB|nr:HDOD domain-containing protein [Pseudodesulfovibrio sp.]MDD3312385.1 EAL domain-containing protein [Pseudodesulfovibrio sp.]
MTTIQAASSEAIFIARQPVFRPDSTLWGYELLFRSARTATANVKDGAQATASVIADGLALATEGMPAGPRILINFPEKLLVEDVGFALPKEACIIELLEDVTPSKETLKATRRLKDAGYTIAVDDFFGQPSLLPFLELADIVKLDILELDSDPKLVRQAMDKLPGRSRLTLLAEKVEDNGTFQELRDLGFDLFQGFFFSRPEIIPGKKLSANEITKLQLLSELSADDFEPRRLAEILQSDPNLSYRLFRYINSVGFGLRQKVTSIKRAIDMMGMLQAKQWLRSALMADLNPAPTGGELAFMAVHRAKFMETVCYLSSRRRACVPDALFITGLFSLLDAMLGMDMDEVLKNLPLDDSIVKALRGASEVHNLLSLARSYEHGDWDEIGRQLVDLDLDPDATDRVYAETRLWAQRMVCASSGGGSI